PPGARLRAPRRAQATAVSAFARERDVAVGAARAAGAIVLRYYVPGIAAREKRPDNPVTLADVEANGCIHRLVEEAFPGDGWLSEETADSHERLAHRRVWVVDPLDGTKEFIQHIPEFCVCVALVEDGRPVVAVEYNPAADRLYAAVRGEGTTVNGPPATQGPAARVQPAVAAAAGDDRVERRAARRVAGVDRGGRAAARRLSILSGARARAAPRPRARGSRS